MYLYVSIYISVHNMFGVVLPLFCTWPNNHFPLSFTAQNRAEQMDCSSILVVPYIFIHPSTRLSIYPSTGSSRSGCNKRISIGTRFRNLSHTVLLSAKLTRLLGCCLARPVFPRRALYTNAASDSGSVVCSLR